MIIDTTSGDSLRQSVSESLNISISEIEKVLRAVDKASRKERYFDCDFFTEEILFDPQTSGGLLASVSKDALADIQKDFMENNLELYVVGEVIEKNEYNVYVRGMKR